jgi:hypothetical protein
LRMTRVIRSSDGRRSAASSAIVVLVGVVTIVSLPNERFGRHSVTGRQ